ncbi:MAG: hypothetical protein KAR83_02785 [Thermodesulfovibrionales bacterium]|nr:hypothetical protein [Thermodesulfovibrionales bacterium]
MKKTSELKNAIEEMLANGDIEGIVNMSKHARGVVRTLIGMTYDKARASSWRAMDAIGRISAAEPEHKARNTVMRLLWMMREESGTNPWSAAEIVGEIVARRTASFEDIVPIVITFAEEPIMRAGAMRAMSRIGAQKPELVREFIHLALEHSADKDPQVRGYAALALRAAGGADAEALLEGLAGDSEDFLYYDGRDLCQLHVSDAARFSPKDYLL